MSNEQLNNLVEATVNPYLVFKVELHHTEEELDKLYQEFSEDFLNKLEKNVIEIEITPISNYLFIKKNFINELRENLKHIKYTAKDASSEIWEMNNLDIFDEGDPAPELTRLVFPDNLTNKEIIKQIFESKFNQDDLLDKISRSGIESLNEIQKQMLNENK